MNKILKLFKKKNKNLNIKEGKLDIRLRLNIDKEIMSIDPEFNTVYLGYDLNEKYFKDKEEFTYFVSECLTHEYIHKIIYDLFNFETTKLYDLIGHWMYKDIDRTLKCISYIYPSKSAQTIYMQWLQCYGVKDTIKTCLELDNTALNQIYLLCNYREAKNE